MMMTIDETIVEAQADDNGDVQLVSPESMFWKPLLSAATNKEDLDYRSFLKKHPWSVSDPGLPSFRVELELEHLHPQYKSSPLVKGGFEPQKQPLLNKDLQGENNKAILKTVGSKSLLKKDILKWVIVVSNVFAEICQATFGQEKNEGKMGRQKYLKLSIITSSICLIMALFEALHEGKKFGIVWQKRGNCCWFYYPGNEGRIFGRFSLYFGLISSIIQLIINLTEKITKKDIVQFDYMPLLLSVCYLVAAIIGSKEKRSSAKTIKFKCNVHGFSEIEGHENRVFQCPQCQLGDN